MVDQNKVMSLKRMTSQITVTVPRVEGPKVTVIVLVSSYDVKVRNLVLDTGSENILAQRTKLSTLRWSGNMLHMTNT